MKNTKTIVLVFKLKFHLNHAFLNAQYRVYTRGLMTTEVNSLIFETLLHITKDASETQAVESPVSVHLNHTHKLHSEATSVSKTPSLTSSGYFKVGKKSVLIKNFSVCVISITDKFI